MNDDDAEGKWTSPLGEMIVKEATDEDVLTPAIQALANVEEKPYPELLLLVQRGAGLGPIASVPMPPDRDILMDFATQDFDDMPWENPDEPLYAVVLIAHSVVRSAEDPTGAEVHIRICSAVTVGGGYTTAWQPAHQPELSRSAGDTPPQWDVLKKEGLDEPLHTLLFRVNEVIRRRKAAQS